MKLSQKILYCRKKNGYSQEVLAQALGISRQAVSKWETGESEPEVSKLKLLADTFHVTTDWLLSEEEPEDNQEANKQQSDCSNEQNPKLHFPGFIGKFIKKHGWISGILILVQGFFISMLGFVVRIAVRSMFADEFWPEEMFAHNPMYTHNPEYVISAVFIVIGVALMIGGGILAIYLKRRFRNEQ